MINNVVKSGQRCPYCCAGKVLSGFNDVLTVYPDVVKRYWSYEKNTVTPQNTYKSSDKKVWWTCGRHHWEAKVHKVTVQGTRCPYCAGKRVLPGDNDLLSCHPEVVDELWDYQLNKISPDEVYMAGTRKAYWRCGMGHSWLAEIRHVVQGRRCGTCSGRFVDRGRTDLLTTDPELIEKYWDFTKNTKLPSEVSRGSSSYKAWWVCSEGHSWSATVYEVVTRGTRCLKCSNRSSTPEDQILSYVRSVLPEYDPHKDRTVLRGQEIDVYVPGLKVGIEFNGCYYHSSKFYRTPRREHIKSVLAAGLGINLLHIWEDDWRDRREAVISAVNHLLKVNYGPEENTESLVVQKVDPKRADEFLSKYDIRGSTQGSHFLGLVNSRTGKIRAAAVIRRRHNNLYIVRFAQNGLTPEAFSILTKYIEDTYHYDTLHILVDRQYAPGYGLTLDEWFEDLHIAPDYSFILNGSRVNKGRVRKDIHDGTSNSSLMDLASEKGIHHVWDCGKIRYTRPHPLRSNNT